MRTRAGSSVGRLARVLLLVFLLGATAARGEDEASGEPTYAGKPASFWLEELKDRDRAPAAYVAFRVIGTSALPLLAAEFGDADRALGRRVLRAIQSVEGDVTPILPALVPLLAHEDRTLRSGVLDLLKRMGSGALPALPAILGHAEDFEWSRKNAWLDVVGAMGVGAAAAEPALLAALKAGPERRSARAAEVLVKVVPSSQRMVTALGVAFDCESTRLRTAIARHLRHADPTLEGWVGILAVARQDPEREVRAAAVNSLAEHVEGSDAVTSELIAALDDEHWHVVKPAAEALLKVGPKAAPAVPALIRVLEGDQEHAHAYAARVLAGLGDAARPALPALIALLGRSRYADAQVGAAIKGMLPYSLPAILEVLAEDDVGRATHAFTLIERVPNEILVPRAATLVEQLARFVRLPGADVHKRHGALHLLARLAPDVPDVLPLLLGMYDHPEHSFRHNAVIVLGRLEVAHPAILESLGSMDAGEREFAWLVLNSIPRDKEVLRTLAGLLRHPEKDVRTRAAQAIVGSGAVFASPSSFRAAPQSDDGLTDALRRDVAQVYVDALPGADPHMRRHIVQTLGALGQAAEVGLPALVEATADPDMSVGTQAAHAITLIVGAGAEPPRSVLRIRLDDENPVVVAGAAQALCGLRDDPAILEPVMRTLLGSADPAVLWRTLGGVLHHGALRGLVPDLIALVRARRGHVTEEAIFALGLTARGDEAVLVLLVDLLDDPDVAIVCTTAFALQRMGAAAEDALPALEGIAEHPDENVRRAVAAALAGIRAAVSRAED